MLKVDKIVLPVTGWFCSVCFEDAQVMTGGETLCLKHAKEWESGYGKSLKQLSDEHKMSTMSKKQSKKR